MTDQPLTVRLSRVFNAPIETVYRAWTDPGQVVQWMKCEAAVELRVEGWQPAVGATFATTMSKPGDWEGEVRGTGVFLEVDPPRLLAYRSDGNEELGMPEQTIRVELTEVEAGTQLSLTHTGLPSDRICGIVEGGWTGSLAMLTDLLVSAPASQS